MDATLGFVRDFSHPESLLAFDYVVPLTDENADAFGVAGFFETMKKEHGDEALLFAIDEGIAESFLADRGLKMIDHLDNEEIEKKFLTDENGSLIGSMTAHFRFVSASPK